MLRRLSTSSIIISIALLALASVTALGQTTSPVQTFKIATPDGGIMDGIVFVPNASGTTSAAGSTVWSAPTATSDEGGSNRVTFTGSDGTVFEGIVFVPNASGTASAAGSTVWSGDGGSEGLSVAPDGGGSTPSTIIITGESGGPRGIIIMSDRSLSLSGLIYSDGTTAMTAGSTVWSAPTATSDEGGSNRVTFTGSDGTVFEGIVFVPNASGTASTAGSTVWSGADLTSGEDSPKTIIITGVDGSFRGVVQTGTSAPTLRGFIYGSN